MEDLEIQLPVCEGKLRIWFYWTTAGNAVQGQSCLSIHNMEEEDMLVSWGCLVGA